MMQHDLPKAIVITDRSKRPVGMPSDEPKPSSFELPVLMPLLPLLFVTMALVFAIANFG